MKKTITTVLFAMCITLTTWAAGVRGDVDGNGIVDVSDIATLVGNLLSGTAPRGNADANCDGSVDVSDVAALVDYLLKGEWPGGGEPENQVITVNGVSFTMIAVKGGTFTMGATDEQISFAYDNEKPTHQVTLSSYSIGQTEVTQKLWYAVMRTAPSNFPGDELPVEKVSWDDCQEFITTLNHMTGMNFRLPTEAEWEFAARGGNLSKGYTYSGSNSINDVAWYKGTSGNATHPVATKVPNELGIYDMSGNVWEWCQDLYGNYSSDAQTNPTGSATGYERVSRGGSWSSYYYDCRVSRRDHNGNSLKSNGIGLRLAL